MLTIGDSSIDSFVQFLTVLVLFVVVLALTYITTRYVANYQKTQLQGKNVTVIETTRIAPNKYVQIVKIGDKYVAIAVSKDSISCLTEVREEELVFEEKSSNQALDFQMILDKMKKRK